MNCIRWCLAFLWPWYACLSVAQPTNPHTVVPYITDTWEELYPIALSPNGDWASYRISRERGPDTTVLMHTKSSRQYKWPQSAIQFLTNDWVTLSGVDGRKLVSLATGQVTSLDGVDQVHVTASADHWLARTGTSLSFTDTQGSPVRTYEQVTHFTLDPKKEKALLTQKRGDQVTLSVVDVRSFRQDTILAAAASIHKMSWSDDGQAFVFTTNQGNADREVLCYYAMEDAEIEEISVGIPADAYSYTLTPRFIQRTHDLSILVHVTALSPDSSADFVDIWAGNDRQLYRKAYSDPRLVRTTQTFYWSKSHPVAQRVNDEIREYAVPLGTDGLFLLVDAATDRDYRHHAGYLRLYVKNMQDQTLTFIADSVMNTAEHLTISPSGKWIAFRTDDGKYHDHRFGAYPVKVHNTVTGETAEIDCPDVQGKLAWSADECSLVLLNSRGMWTWDTRTGSLQRYFSIGEEIPQSIDILNLPYGASVIDLEQPLLIHAVNLDNNHNQLVRLINGETHVLVPSRPERIARTVFTPDINTVLYTIENFDLPYVLQVARTGDAPETLVRSNSHVREMPFSRQEILTYTNRHQQTLKGTLYYPKTFDPQKTYPMVVHVYESQYHLANRFVYPHLRNGTGYNEALLAQEGYFVYQPDIVYNEEGPGLSALDCVTAALEAAFHIKQIDPDRVGLIGQSFGSYETNFLIGQTDQFAAAVSGNGMGNMLMDYYYFNYNYHVPSYSKYETGQYRMFSPYYADKEKYRANSPIEFVHQIQTPLLLWAGRQDLNVPWKQTENFYTALRRFNVPQIALFYKEEGHVLIDPDSQRHLTRCVLDWFNYYLKDQTEITWIKEGVTP